jgi:integrase
MAQTDLVTKDDVRLLIGACFEKLTSETEAHSPIFADPAREIHEQCRMIDERLQELRTQIRSGEFEADVEAVAAAVLRKHGYKVDNVPPGLERDLMEGVARAMVEQSRLHEFRLGERLMPYEPSDALFAHPQRLSPVPQALTAEAQLEPVVVGPTVKEAVDRYLVAKRKAWRPKTFQNFTCQLRLLVEHLGPDRRLGLVTTDEMRAFREGLLRLRRNHHVGASPTFIGRQTDSEALRIEPKTALIQLQNSRTFLRWAVTEGYLEKDPSAGLQVPLPKKVKAKKSRRSFTAADLEKLFRAPIFTGCKSAGRRHEAGAVVMRDAEYWLPILGYLTGARMGELVQLHVTDIHVEGAIPFIEITDENSGELGSGFEKHVKSAAGVRQVPIHPHLIELGFLDFALKRRKDKRATKRLFFEIPFGKDGQASSAYSKRFARLLDKAGLKDKTLVFHSFRHTAEDALRDALTLPYVKDRIIGHADDAVSAQYGQGISLEVAAQAVKDMKLLIDVRPFLNPT